ncbi:hypothetical protein [Rathayibacter sp. VKM Ac-2630]|uniref:hypothetical protein n=1 Tax=Rathayibacter sp. VKM Ac-2630 TaxID=1938617 RepID=UPI00098198E0|nr:hypothetical protein [Rathayibacter sp. VKM Ac-2630]OOB90900.1 hypothetical protein B0T42_09165 [Rathayibacter sp. VKM Ac-2630]
MAAATPAPSMPAGLRTVRIAALATAGIAANVAFMLWLAHTQITDYPTYDTAYAGAFETGVLLSVGVAVLALVVAGATAFRRTR